MGKGVHDKKSQLTYIENRIDLLSQVVGSMKQESAQVEDLDRVIAMLSDLQFKCEQFRKDWEKQ